MIPHTPMPFCELSITSNFTFLHGASHPEDYVMRAGEMGMAGIAIADINSVAGIVRAHTRAREIGRDAKESEDGPRIRLIPAAKIVLADGFTATALPQNRKGWGNLCRLLTLGRRRAGKGECALHLPDLLEWAGDMAWLIHPARGADWQAAARALTRASPHCHIMMAPRYDGQDGPRFARLAALADSLGIPTIASAAPLMHHGSRRKLADVLCAIRHGVRIEQLGRRALPNAEQRLRSDAEMRRLFRGHEGAVDRAGELADSLTFSLDELRYEYPSELANGETAPARLARLTEAGLNWRYPDGVPAKARAQVAHELKLINKMGYEPYFLTVHDIVAFARQRGILCQGRGSAANSVVCYALGVTSVSPEIGTMVFERFVSEARNEPPDIDVDFEHERREEVIQHIYARYGRDRAAIAATLIRFRERSAIREVGKAMGLTEDITARIAKSVWGAGGKSFADLAEENGLLPSDDRRAEGPEGLNRPGPHMADPRIRHAMEIAEEIQDFPRHLATHVGGFVITRGKLTEQTVVVAAAMEGRTTLEWDKDDIEALRILKVDVLGLGMLTCIRRAFALIEGAGGPRLVLHSVPQDDPATYAMLSRADSIGVFQVESRAQMNMLPRLRPREFYDLVIQVAIVRPGPIQGDMVHPYLRRRNGEEPVEYPSEDLRGVLGKTLGVPLFQEQAMRIAIVAAGFTPARADQLRRAMATFRHTGEIGQFREDFHRGMAARGYDPDFAERCFQQIEGFGTYGFPESHAASFAGLVYVSAWIKRHHPTAFAAALLNSQPMGFYAPAQIVRDARDHGVEVRPVDATRSDWDCTLEMEGAAYPPLPSASACGWSPGWARRRRKRSCKRAASPPSPISRTLPTARGSIAAQWARSPAPMRCARSPLAGARRCGTPPGSRHRCRWPRPTTPPAPTCRRRRRGSRRCWTMPPPASRSVTTRWRCCAPGCAISAPPIAARSPPRGRADASACPAWCWSASARAAPRAWSSSRWRMSTARPISCSTPTSWRATARRWWARGW